MDAEIRRLTYVPRSKHGNGGPGGFGSLVNELPPLLRGEDAGRQSPKSVDLRLEMRVIELERERAEMERSHCDALAATAQRGFEETAAALQEQKNRLDREWAGTVQDAVVAFHQAQAQYFADVEASVVRLALGIAARVLHREAQLDPLLLRGPVRVALEDAKQSLTCVLEIAAERAEVWEQWLAGSQAASRVQIRSREDVEAGHCKLEIGASTADLSVDAQLMEIERGFFDLLQRRPAARTEVTE